MGTFTDPFSYTGTPVTLEEPGYFSAVGKHWSFAGAGTNFPLITSTGGFVKAPQTFYTCFSFAEPTPDVVTSFIGSAEVACNVPFGTDSSIGWEASLSTVADHGTQVVTATLQYNYGGSGTGQQCRIVLALGLDNEFSSDFTMGSTDWVSLKLSIDTSHVYAYKDGVQVASIAYCGYTLAYGRIVLATSADDGSGLPSVNSDGGITGFKFRNFSWTYDTVGTPVTGCGGDAAQTLSPTTATVHPGDTVHFTTNNAANFGIVANSGKNTGGSVTTGGGSGRTVDGGTPSGTAGSIQNGSIFPDSGTGSQASSTGATFTAGSKIGTETVTAVDASDPTNTATATITVTPRVVNIPALSSIFHAFLYGSHGARKPLNTNRIRFASWTDERYGGWTGFQMDLNITLETPDDASVVSATDRIELWFYGERRYRGFVTSVVVVEADPPTLTLNGYGIGFQATKPIIQHAYIYPHGIDVSQVFAEVIQENVTPLFPALRIEATPVGVLTQQLESTYKSVSDAITDLVENQAENLALWGGDADSSGNDRLYIKPFSTTHDWSIPVPGKNVEAAQSELQTGDVVNRLTILGGNPKYPNLIYNSSFERPRFSNESEGNLVLNANFEEATNWAGTGAYLAADETIGNAFTGARMWQTILDTENGTQTQNPTAIPVVPGWDYTVAAQLKWKTNVGLPEGRITLHWLNSGGSTLQTDILDTGVLSDGWIPFSMTSRAPAGATGYTLDIRTQSGGDSGNAILWDAIQIAPATVIYQDKWEVDVIGTASINRLNWAYRDGIDGGYCALIDMTALDTDTDEAYLQPLNGEKFEVTPGAVYTAGVYLKSPPGVATNGKLRIQIQQYDKDGNMVVVDHINIASGSGWSVWTQEYGTFTIDPSALHAVIKLVWRGTSAVLVDAFSLRDSAAGHGFIRDGQFALQISADQLVLEGYSLSTAAANSVDTYGYRDAVETVDGITEDGEAREYAATYFNVHAPAFPLPTVTAVDDRRFFRPGQNVRLIGRDGPTMMDGQDMLPIVKIDWTWDGMLHAAIQMQKEMPDLASLLKKGSQGVNGGGVGGGSGSFTSTSAGAAPIPVGSAGSSVAAGTDISVSIAGTVHTVSVAPADRDSSIFGLFATLDARFENLEALLTGATVSPAIYSLDFSIPVNSQYLALGVI